MFDKILIPLCLLAVAVSSVMTASFYPTCKCSPKMLKCPKLNCPPGSLPVEHPCLGCCRICGKTEGEECGGVNDIYGRCSPDLECQPGMFTFGKLSNLRGTCSKPFGFDMTADFLRLDDFQKDLWDNWDFSFASSDQPKEIYNVFDVVNDYLKPEDVKQEMWEGWDFSFSSDKQSSSDSQPSSDTTSDSFHDIKPSEVSTNEVSNNEVSTNEIWDDWTFSFSSGTSASSNSMFEHRNSNPSDDEEGSGSFYNRIIQAYPPV